ncbi:MAG: hypothetical protein K6E51_02365 [Treponema sp.]|nr:hypothetical protein [Treponema sp.]
MKIITVSGAPSSGKTAVIIKTLEQIRSNSLNPVVFKFDCISAEDESLYKHHGIHCITGLAGNMCPDHYFVSNIDECVTWGEKKGYTLLISESAGLCNRCAPHIQNCLAVCVVDNLMGINTPKKIGPMLKMADVVVVTKGDIVSQAEREIFALRIRQANPKCIILSINGINGQGAIQLATLFERAQEIEDIKKQRLRITMPAALCSYCLGERRLGQEKQKGNVRKIQLD